MPKEDFKKLIKRGNNVDKDHVPKSGWNKARLELAKLVQAYAGCGASIYLHMLYFESDAQIAEFRSRVALKYGADFAKAMPLVSTCEQCMVLPLFETCCFNRH
jgi:hypothetical protein